MNKVSKSNMATAGVIVAAVVPTLILYLASGVLDGFLAADDFGWLTTARDADWRHLFSFGEHDHFFRPVIRLWFAGAVRVCSDSSTCYHFLNLTVHAINTLLFAALSVLVTRDRIFAALAAMTFALSPGYVEAVVWVSSITELLSTLFLLATAVLALKAADSAFPTKWYVAALMAMLALFSHEASASLFLLIPFILWISGRISRVRLRDVWPFAAVALLFIAGVAIANYRNVIFTEGRYTVGSHVVVNALDYLVSMYVGPHRWTGYLFVALAASAIMALGPPMARAGIVWILVTMLPFLGFTWGNSSRYLYLPTMGFGWVTAALLLSLSSRLTVHTSRRVATATAALIAVIVIGRFGVFTSTAIKNRLEWLRTYRDYAQAILVSAPAARATGELVVPKPDDSRFDLACIQPMLRWTLKLPDLRVTPDIATATPFARGSAVFDRTN